MSRIEWDETFSVNNDEIDKQHKAWIDVLNRLHDSMLNDDCEDTRKLVPQSMNAMVSYTEYHFKLEEDYMRGIGYPDLVDHVKLHENFVHKIRGYDKDIKSGDLVRGSKIIGMMQEWITEHILTEDRKYAVFASPESGGDVI